MKKYLMKGFAAIVFCGAIASCSRDLGADDGAVQSTVQETYEKAFITQFGQPASTQNWGFGPSTTAKTRTVSNNIIPGKVWPQKAGTRGETVWVQEEQYYKVPDGFNPSDGETVEVKGYNNVTYGVLTFHGNNNTISVADNSKNHYDHYIIRKAISFTPYFDMDQAYFQMTGDWNDSFYCSDNDEAFSTWGNSWWGVHNNGEMNLSGNVKSGHTYRIWYDNSDVQFWGLKLYHQGNVEVVIPANNNQNNEQSSEQNNEQNSEQNNEQTDQGGETTNTGTSTTLYNQNNVICSVTDEFPARFDQSYFDTIKDNMREFGKTTSNNNFEFVSTGPFDFSVIYSVTSAHDEVGFYYYNPAAGETVDNRTEVKFVDDIQYPGNYYRVDRSWDHYYTPGPLDSDKIWEWGDVSAVVAKIFTIDVPVGYRVGFWIQNSDPYPRFYSNQSLNTSDNLYYSAVVNLEDDTFLVGLEDWWSVWGGDNDCNDIIMSVKKGTTPPTIVVPDEEFQEIVVLAEDLTIDDAHPDFDFNDVVFKVRHYTAGDRTGKTEVTVLAAGGTLPLYIDDQEVHAKFAEENPNKVITTGTMINTYGGRHSEYATPTFEVTASGSTIQDIANSIKLQVQKFGKLIDITAPVGAVPAKIAVTTDFLLIDWCDERTDINNKFTDKEGNPLFSKYVQGQLDNDWYRLLHISNTQTNQ